MKKRAAIFLKALGWTVIAVALVYVTLLLLASLRLKRAYGALEAAGRPMVLEEVIPADLPDTRNAALLYEAAMLRLKAEPHEESDLYTTLEEASDRMLEDRPAPEAVEAFRQLSSTPAAEEALANLRAGTSKPGCRFDVDYTMGIETLMPHVLYMRDLSKILSATARLQAADGDLKAAWDTNIAGFHLANTLRDEPTLISQLVRIVMFDTAVDTMRFLAAHAHPSDAQYDAIMILLAGFEEMGPLVNALDGERLLFGEWIFKQPRKWSGGIDLIGDDIPLAMALGQLTPPFMRFNHAAYLNVFHGHTANAQQPYSEHDAVLDKQLINNVPRYLIFARMVVPSLHLAKRRYISMTARARVSRAGLAALRYRQKEGTYPADLGVLGLGDLLDPFTGKALVYRATPTGLLVYSLGVNQVDDRGTASEKKDEGDIVWRHGDSEDPEAPANETGSGVTSASAGP